MIISEEDSKLLASLTVFRELYNSGQDVYSVISKFINYVINEKGLYIFTLPEITSLINSTFDFNLLEPVIETAIGRLKYITRSNAIFNVDLLRVGQDDGIREIRNQANIVNASIFDSLYSFIEHQLKQSLTKQMKLDVVSDFCSFLLDESIENNYSSIISAYIISNKDNQSFTQNINKIREGVIIYSGLKYNNNISDVGSWKNELTIYLDTEVIFHLAGYNGKIFKELFDNFYDYVKEINNKNTKKRLIKLKYFPQVKYEINNFFSKARYILEGKDQVNPEKTAMCYLVNGCNDISSLVEKQSDLFSLMNQLSIEEERVEIFDDKGSLLKNIISDDKIQILTLKYGFDVYEHIKFLNSINILRDNQEVNNFYNMKSILLTGNTRTIQLAWDPEIKKERVVPLATTLHWITNKFWFKLNKGFGNGKLPKSFDIITKALISLSHILNESIGNKYVETVTEYQKGNISEEQVKSRIVYLKSNVRKPEDIDADEACNVLEIISLDNLTKYIYEQEQFKSEAKKNAEENTLLKEKTREQEESIKSISKSKVDEIHKIEIEKDASFLQEKKKMYSILKDQYDDIVKKANKEYSIKKYFIFILYLFYYCTFVFLIIKYSWSVMEMWVYIFGIFPLIITALYFVIFEKSIKPVKLLSSLKGNCLKSKIQKIKFDFEYYNKLKLEIMQLELEIERKEKEYF